MQKSLYGIWLIITVFTAALILFSRHRRTQKWNLKLNETIELALSNFGGISGGYLIYQSYVLYDSLSKLVGNEGIIAMFLGGLASVWFAFGKVKELIDKP
jgi:prolipoprotein diacylglyceryltransferase